MEQGDWQNDADYPRAPLPAHERTWRHPSEVGAEQWVRSEPPLVVGRGLSVATGTVGAVLALGLLWLMVPHPSGGPGVAVESSTTTVRTVAIASSAPSPRSDLVAPAAEDDTMVAPTGSTTSTGSESTVTLSTSPASTVTPVPMPTMVLDSTAGLESLPPVAVALVPGHHVVTTAAAVRGREGFTVMLPSGVTVTGAVVSVDIATGTAVLSVGARVDDAVIQPSTTDLDTEGGSGHVVVMTPEATSARLWADDAGTQIGYDDDGDDGDVDGGGVAARTGEGSVVLDGDGRLVGLCTRSAQGVRLVTVADLLDALVAAAEMETPAWLGVEFDLDDAGNVVVTRVLADGPGGTAGIRVGDIIAAVDGVAVSDLATVREIVAGHAAGDALMLSIHQAPAPHTSTTGTTGTTGTTASAGQSVQTTGSTSAPASSNGAGTVVATTIVATAATTAATPTTAATTTTATSMTSTAAPTATATSNTTVAVTVDIAVVLTAAPDAP